MSNQQKRQTKRKNRASGSNGNQPSQKKQKTQGQQRRQRKRRNARNGRAMTERGGAGEQSYAATAYATEQIGKAPVVNATRETCRVTHREFIGNVSGTTAFTISQTLAINPGMAATFPWLSVIAQNWETYRFRKLRLCYYTRTGTNVPGSVIMAHDPDASDQAPATEQIMTSYELCVEDAPWKDIMMVFSLLGLSDIGPRKFVRNGPLAANSDIKLYDSGNAYVATVDGTAVNWGKLWIEYDVDFYTPQLPPGGSAPFGGLVTGSGTQSAANPLGTTGSVDAQAVGISVSATSVVTVANVGTYSYVWTVVGTVVSDAIIVGSAGAAVQAISSAVNAGATAVVEHGYVVVTIPNSTLTLTATATTVTAGTVFVLAQVPTGSMA